MTPYDPEATIVTNNASIPSDVLLCINTTFFIIGNITRMTVEYPERVSVRSVFDAYHVKTQCMYPATCQGYGIYLRTVTSKLDKMVCEYAINRTKFEDTYASNDSHKHLSWPPSDGNNPSNKTNMDHNLVIWMAPVNITDWNRVYPPNDGCHNGPLPHLFYPTNNSEVNKFCLSYGIYPTTPIPYITE